MAVTIKTFRIGPQRDLGNWFSSRSVHMVSFGSLVQHRVQGKGSSGFMCICALHMFGILEHFFVHFMNCIDAPYF